LKWGEQKKDQIRLFSETKERRGS